MEILQLSESTRSAAERFLVQHRDSSMFLRSNILRSGFEYTGRPYEGTYVAAIEAGDIVAIIGHTWNGVLTVQAPLHAESLAHAVVRASGRVVTGLSGPAAQVLRVRAALGLTDAPAQLDAIEELYGLELNALRVLPPLANLACRPARATDRDALLRLRVAFELEALHAVDDDALRTRLGKSLDAHLTAKHVLLAAVGGEIVSHSAFNAALPDIVQLGGIYTPPEQRGRGYAKHVIAAQLRAARDAGVSRCVLFTQNPSAVRCYRALGFERLSEFALVLLERG